MKNKKILIILISILIVLVIVVLVILKSLKKNNEELEFAIDQNPEITTSIDIEKLKNENEFYTVEDCINKYFQVLNRNNTEGIYNLLNSEYLKKNGINISNVLQNVYQLQNGFEEFFAKDIYYKEISYNKEYQYYVFGELLGENYKTIQTIYIIVNLDYENMSFNITLPEKIEVSEFEYVEIINKLRSGNTGEFIYVKDQENSLGIKLNNYNKLDENVSSDPYRLENYLKNYTTMAVYYPDIAFNLLDEEFRNKKFKNVEEYKKYVLDNKYRILNSTIKEYNISEKEGYYQYIIKDTNDNYYIFKVTDIMKYSIITDFYTLEIEEIANNYDNSNVQQRGVINIQKVVAALNNKDYNYVYDKLDGEFKKNKYPTLEVFKEKMSTLIIGNPKLTLGEFRNEGEIYIYDITLESSRASAGAPVNMQIIMKLKENRDYVMSFNIK